jgi:7-cyano-7-deazaguanine synthase in queuosine biosynthesis
MKHNGNPNPVYQVQVLESSEPRGHGVIQCVIGKGKNLSFEMYDLASYCFASLEPLVFDALLLAAAIEFCDRSLRRSARCWARRITLQLPVHDVEHWGSDRVTTTLIQTLNFLTGDLWLIAFGPRKCPMLSPTQQPLSLITNAKAVIPFSDGLDSWAVAQLATREAGLQAIRVRLSSSKTGRRPSDSQQPFAFVPYTVKAKSNGQPLTTGRHRGFKFAMIAAIAAYLANVDKVIMPESGQGALGPALVPVGQMCPDYRSHPLFAMRMERFVTALFGRPIHYDFLGIWNTKAETLRVAIASSIEGNGWAKTRSCWHGSRRAGVNGERRQCDVCASCLLRRLSVHAAGLNEKREIYIWEDLCASTFEIGAAATFAKSFKPFRDYFVAGALHLKYLADLVQSERFQATLQRHALELSEWRGEDPAELEIKLRRLVEKHAEEWEGFVLSLGSASFLSILAGTAA